MTLSENVHVSVTHLKHYPRMARVMPSVLLRTQSCFPPRVFVSAAVRQMSLFNKFSMSTDLQHI